MVALNESVTPFGRPSKFEKKFSVIARKMCLMGATEADLAEAFEVSITTIKYWKSSYKTFNDACLIGKGPADNRVEASLYQRAVGYSHEDVDIRTVSIGEGITEIVKTPIIKHYPPDPASMIFWLKNRKPREWRDKIETQLTSPDGANFVQQLALVVAQALANPERKELPPIEVSAEEVK